MTSNLYARTVALAGVCCALAVPTASAAVTPSASGAAVGGFSGGSSGGAGLNPSGVATPVGGPVSAQGNGFTLSTSAAGTYQRTLSFSGSVASTDSGDVVNIQRQVAATRWQTVAHATVTSLGGFQAGWSASTSGLVGFRATLTGPADSAQAASMTSAAASPTLAVTIYRNATATIYGPGFYGRKTACGIKLSPTTLGVASRTLKCGAKVSIDYNGRSITVPVIDRGPYANGATWDLTEATAQALGDPDTETVGAAVL